MLRIWEHFDCITNNLICLKVTHEDCQTHTIIMSELMTRPLKQTLHKHIIIIILTNSDTTDKTEEWLKLHELILLDYVHSQKVQRKVSIEPYTRQHSKMIHKILIA